MLCYCLLWPPFGDDHQNLMRPRLPIGCSAQETSKASNATDDVLEHSVPGHPGRSWRLLCCRIVCQDVCVCYAWHGVTECPPMDRLLSCFLLLDPRGRRWLVDVSRLLNLLKCGLACLGWSCDGPLQDGVYVLWVSIEWKPSSVNLPSHPSAAQ